MLDMAVLGLLREGPMHGYELKQRLVDLGFWRISFGSVYPALRRLERAEFIEGTPGSGRRKETRIEFLERRKTVLRVRIAAARNSLRRTADRVDRYTHSLMEHGVRSAEADVAWLDELIASGRTHDEGPQPPP